MDIKEIQERLSAPFYPSEIEWRLSSTNAKKTSGIAVPYITNRAIQNRLDEVLGITGWKNEFIANDKFKICGISLRINDEWITKYDGADDTNIEATKGGVSNAMKRAAVQWGIGRYLYKLPTFWVPIEKAGNSYKIKGKPPELPAWALPKEMNTNKPQEFTEDYIIPIPKHIQAVISSFKQFEVTQADLENYVNNEAFAFTDDDLETLRGLYKRLNRGEHKADIFPQREKAKNKVLDKQLEEINK